MAWAVGEGIIIYRSVKAHHRAPWPGELLFSSGLFVMLAILAESEKLRTLAVIAGWGFDAAAFLNLYPGPGAAAAGAAGGSVAAGLAGGPGGAGNQSSQPAK
jgi:hypothetical protein